MNPSQLIDKKIAAHPDWRGRTMEEVRRIIRDAVPDVTEEWKWMGTPTWSHNGKPATAGGARTRNLAVATARPKAMGRKSKGTRTAQKTKRAAARSATSKRYR